VNGPGTAPAGHPGPATAHPFRPPNHTGERTAMSQHGHQSPSPGRYVGVVSLVAVLIGIIAVAFRGSWGAFRDAALACHFDRDSASLYPFAADGLIIVAIIAMVLLRHDKRARWYCLGIIGTYTSASLLINSLHGVGLFQSDPVTGTRPVPPWPVVLVVASIVVGSIFLGSHLLVLVGRHLWPDTAPEPQPEPAGQVADHRDTVVPDEPEPPATRYEAAVAAYRYSRRDGGKGTAQRDLIDRYGITKREASRVQQQVNDELNDDPGEDDPEETTAGQPAAPLAHLNGHAPLVPLERP
jgi:hypothetical protein